MKMQTYLDAKDLVEDIKKIDRIIEEAERKQHWVAISTPDNNLKMFSLKFQNDLINWLKSIKEKYEKDFDELI